MNSDQCKLAICDYIAANLGCIKELFSSKDASLILETELLSPCIWKRTYKAKEGGNVVRNFAAFGSKQLEVAEQITAEVRTDGADMRIVKILIEG